MFQWFNLLVILANTGVMAAVSYPMDPDWDAVDNYLNYAFTVYFVLELFVKVVALGPKRYIKDRMNQFDALVVVASLVELAVHLAPGVSGKLPCDHHHLGDGSIM